MVTKFLTATFTADLWTVRALRLRRGTHERGDHLVIILRMPFGVRRSDFNRSARPFR